MSRDRGHSGHVLTLLSCFRLPERFPAPAKTDEPRLHSDTFSAVSRPDRHILCRTPPGPATLVPSPRPLSERPRRNLSVRTHLRSEAASVPHLPVSHGRVAISAATSAWGSRRQALA